MNLAHYRIPAQLEQRAVSNNIATDTHLTVTAPVESGSNIAKKASPSTVFIESAAGLGSGFVIGDGLVATNFHVIDDAQTLTVRVVRSEKKYPVEWVRNMDPVNDLAILAVPQLKAPALPLGDSSKVEVGSTIYAIGNPQGLEGTISNGIISAKRDLPEGGSTAARLQITAAISPGSSGGPVLDEAGNVIGVVVSQLSSGQNLNFAVPVNELKGLLKEKDNKLLVGKTDSKFLNFLKAAYNEAREFENMGDYKNALGIYSALIKKSAISAYEKALAFYFRAILYKKTRAFPLAISDYSVAISFRQFPEYLKVDALSFRAFCYVETPEYLKAIDDCVAVIAMQNATAEQKAEALHCRGLAYRRDDNTQKAIADFGAVIAMPDASAEQKAKALFDRGVAYWVSRNTQEAIADFDAVIAMPDAPEEQKAKAFSFRGLDYSLNGNKENAIQDYSAIIAMSDVPEELKAKAQKGIDSLRSPSR